MYWQNLKYYLVSIFAILFVLLANNSAFANEKENIFLSQNCSKVELAKEMTEFWLCSVISENDFPNQRSYIRLGGVEGVGKVVGVAAKTSTKAVTSYYPKNGGALGKWSTEYLMPGTKIDRFVSGFGKYFSPHGTPVNMRALPSGNTGAYNALKVVKPFPVQSSTITPAFNKIGLGTQYLSPVNMNILLKRGIIVPLK
jgi:hypothetical protein